MPTAGARADRVTTGIWIIALAAGTLAGCDESNTTTPDHIAFTVEMVNTDNVTGGANVNLFGIDETFPCCETVPGGSRILHISGGSPGSIITFKAGRNGVVVGSASCASYKEDRKTVVWVPVSTGSSTGTLSCGTGW